LDSNLWGDGQFKFIELTQNVRQQDDKDFAELLSRVRVGSAISDDIDMLMGRLLSEQYASDGECPSPEEFLAQQLEKYPDKETLCLTSLNDHVDSFNEEMLRILKIETIDLHVSMLGYAA